MVSRISKRCFFAGTLLAAVLAGWIRLQLGSDPDLSSQGELPPAIQLSNQVQQLRLREQRMADSVWAPEVLAQHYGRTMEAIWDEINAAEDKLARVAELNLGTVRIGWWRLAERAQPHGIQVYRWAGESSPLSPSDWDAWVRGFWEAGWRLEWIEFRHQRFQANSGGHSKAVDGSFARNLSPIRSEFFFRAGLWKTSPENPENWTAETSSRRVLIEGTLAIKWKTVEQSRGKIPIAEMDARRLELRSLRGRAPFRLVLEERITPPENARSIDPLIVAELDGDGRLEIILAGKNLIYRDRRGDGHKAEPLCVFPPRLISTALLADITGDGFADLLCVRHQGLVLLPGGIGGLFDRPEIMLWPAPRSLKYPMALTCGDADQDGDLDIFIGQYKVPYENGTLPTPFYDANDGHPFYLLRNEGNLRFAEVTADSGLAAKRRRRVYSASFVDADGKNGPDLAIVSDFAGAELYLNNGQGRFADATTATLAESHGFGMAHSFADFNLDGRLDFLMIGMNSPTVDRLEAMGLRRAGLAGNPSMRSRMTYGNRLFLSRADGRFEQNALSHSIARSGWAWGCGSADFDNDGFPDVFIANGMESRESVRDYEPEYWLHDAFVANSARSPKAHAYFQAKFAATRAKGHSYGGYETNRLYLNQSGEIFLEAGYLLGLGLQRDSRNAVADDFDGDGRVDVLMTHFERWPDAGQILRIYRNELPKTGNWIGFRFARQSGAMDPAGTRITVQNGKRIAVDEVVSGDSYRSQHAASLHFGLGKSQKANRVVLRQPNGQSRVFKNLPANRYYFVDELPSPQLIFSPENDEKATVGNQREPSEWE